MIEVYRFSPLLRMDTGGPRSESHQLIFLHSGSPCHIGHLTVSVIIWKGIVIE